MAATEVELKSPFLSPFFKGGIFSVEFFPSLEKRGRGDFQAEMN
jgi:hypothetical protein